MERLQSEKLGTKDEMRCCACKHEKVPPLMAVQQHIEFAGQEALRQSQHVDDDADRIHGIHHSNQGEDLSNQRISERSLEKHLGRGENPSGSKSAKDEKSEPTKSEILESGKGENNDAEQREQ